MGCGNSKEAVQETSAPASVPAAVPGESQQQAAASNTTKTEKKVEFAPEPVQDRRKSTNPPVKPILMSDLVPETNRFADVWDLGQVVSYLYSFIHV
jgi:hypothetical protein